MLITLLPAMMAAAVMQAPPSPQGFGEARPSLFDYDKTKPADIRFTSPAVTVRHLTYAQIDGTTNGATLVTPPTTMRGPHPAVLYVHWYEPPRPTSNRTEFLAEAVDLAAAGTVSLLVDTPWAGESWFPTRNGDEDTKALRN